jgi:hypothetical protein
MNDAGYADAMRTMTDEIINSDMLTTYLVATNICNNKVQVTVAHSIARYSAGFGGSNALHGQVLALLGETVGDQLPMLVKFVDQPGEDLSHALAMEEVTVPSEIQVATYFTNPAAENLMPATTVAQGGVDMNLSNMCPIPLAWAPYFLDFKEPRAALEMGHALVATLGTVEHRTRAGPILDWFRATCTRLGANAADRRRSLLDQGFEATAPDARVITWMQRRLAPYKVPTASNVVAPNNVAPTGAPVLAGGLSAPTGEKEYSQLETGKIQAACSLTDAQWATDLPELYTRMLDEGRTTVRVQALLEDTFRPMDSFSLSAVHLGVTTDMAKDIKELNFGYSNDISYDTSHRGISPFTVIGVSMIMASKRRRHADRFTRTSNLTLAEVTMAETTPDALPTEYHGLINLLRRYVEFLKHVVGERCLHYIEVLRIAAELNTRQFIFETLDARQIASLLWQIFMDARRFFSAGTDVRGTLPQSLLRTLYNEVAAGIVQTHLNVPYASLMGQGTGEASYSNEHEGGTGAAPPVREAREARSFRHVPPPIKAILQGARSKYPSLTIAELMAAHEPPLQYAQVKLGPSGSCLDFLCFGLCKNARCSYKHGATAAVPAARAAAIAPKLGAAYAAYDAAH